MVDRDGNVPGNELAVVVAEDHDRTPLEGEDQFGKTIAIQIPEYGAADQADVLQARAVFLVELKFALFALLICRPCQIKQRFYARLSHWFFVDTLMLLPKGAIYFGTHKHD